MHWQLVFLCMLSASACISEATASEWAHCQLTASKWAQSQVTASEWAHSQLTASVCRSAPRSCTVRQSVAAISSSHNKVADRCLQSNDCTEADKGTAIDIDLDTSLVGDTASETPLTKSKAISRLAALQVASRGYTPSPVALRRRLQGRKPTEAVAAGVFQDLSASPEVICIDC